MYKIIKSPVKLKVAIWDIYMSEKSMLGFKNRAFSVEFEILVRLTKNLKKISIPPGVYISVKKIISC